MFPKAPCSVAGYGDNVEIPKIAQDSQADYEGELTVVICRDAKNVSIEDTLDYVLGYTVANDVSAQKLQMDPGLVGTLPPPQMSFGKSFDMFASMGPCIASTKVIEDPHNLPISAKVNGETRQDSNTSVLIFNIPQITAFCSQGTTLQAGSVILTGSLARVGFAMKPPRYLVPGDTVESLLEKSAL